jgi:5-(carboxyamino)imidazole ribonucleotide synthase
VILPGATLGVLGGGQLGRMFALQARVMGYRVAVLDPDPASPAGRVAVAISRPRTTTPAPWTAGLHCAAVTIEFENVPAASLERLACAVPVRPAAAAVAVAQDRIREKTSLAEHGFATAPFRAVTDPAGLEAALDAIPLPALIKTSRLGYDGKGQATVERREQAAAAFARLGGVPCVFERRLALERELSVVQPAGPMRGRALR